MEQSNNQLSASSEWQKLQNHAEQVKQRSIASLFAEDPQRFSRLSIELPGLLFDYSKQNIDSKQLDDLFALARQGNLEQWRDRMFQGEAINITENRSVLHTALRNLDGPELSLDNTPISQLVRAELIRIKNFVNAITEGQKTSFTDKVFTDVVNIGIGGSNLGPQMITDALSYTHPAKLKVHYVSNVDGTLIHHTLKQLNPETTLFIVSSKSFGTVETRLNAETAQNWLCDKLGSEAFSQHFIAVTANKEKAIAQGYDENNILNIWDWVGGRFSLWSAIGLPIALAYGFPVFEEVLKGGSEIDKHFADTPLEKNIPVIMGLLSLWNTSFLGINTQAILPYDQPLHKLPAYLQQAEMESNGKSVSWDGQRLSYTTGPIIWGSSGIDGQHAFYQFLHQSNTLVATDFIGSVQPIYQDDKHHHNLLANLFAQSQALMNGINEQQIANELSQKGFSDDEINRLIPHKVHQGSRPSSTLLLDKITPTNIGKLVALYEHKLFVQGILLQICSFDQWGVELGKVLAANIEPELAQEMDLSHHDGSTQGLIHYFKKHQ